MEHNKKNKLLTWLVLLLLIANAGSIAMFWLDKEKQPARQQQHRERPAEFLKRILQLDTKQQAQLEVLRAKHKDSAIDLRKQLQTAKESFFLLIKQPGVTDSMKLAAAKSVSMVNEKIGLLTLNHFIKVRAICTAAQQIKFDEIIKQLTEMISKAGEDPPGDENQPPPPANGKEENRPPSPSER